MVYRVYFKWYSKGIDYKMFKAFFQRSGTKCEITDYNETHKECSASFSLKEKF